MSVEQEKITAPPRPSLSVVGAVGRLPSIGGALRGADLEIQVTDYGDAVDVRIDSDRYPELWLIIRLQVNRDDHALARLADDGNPLGGD